MKFGSSHILDLTAMQSVDDAAAVGAAPQPATQLTLARTRLTASDERMPETVWRAYRREIRETSRVLEQSMGGHLTEEGVEIKDDFDGLRRLINDTSDLEHVIEAHERMAWELYERAIEYLASHTRATRAQYDEGEQAGPRSERRALSRDLRARKRSIETSRDFLGRLVEDVKELREQRRDLLVAEI